MCPNKKVGFGGGLAYIYIYIHPILYIQYKAIQHVFVPSHSKLRNQLTANRGRLLSCAVALNFDAVIFNRECLLVRNAVTVGGVQTGAKWDVMTISGPKL